jgi:hypothetical protein
VQGVSSSDGERESEKEKERERVKKISSARDLFPGSLREGCILRCGLFCLAGSYRGGWRDRRRAGRGKERREGADGQGQ